MARLAGSSKLLRAMNESATLAYLLDRGTLTRGDLRELTGLSKPTTSDVLRRLTDAGLAVVVGHTSGGPGPNAEIYAANPAAGYAVALSIRDTTETPRPPLAAAMCDLTGTILARTEDVDAAAEPADLVAASVAGLCARSGIAADRVTHIQLGVPGSYDPGTDTIHHIDVPGWARPGLVGALAERLDATIGVDNDVNLAAIAERNRGVARDAGSFTLLWFSAGLGLAIDLGGTLLRGARGGAGEIGYMPLHPQPAGVDRVGLHELVGGRAVVALAAEHGLTATTPEQAVATAVAACRAGAAAGGTVGRGAAGTPPAGGITARGAAAAGGTTGRGAVSAGGTTGRGAAGAVPATRTGGSTARVADGAAAGKTFIHALAERIAFALAGVAAVLDPPLVVLAGEVAQAGGQLLRDAVAAALAASSPFDTTIEVTALTDDAVLLGALDAGLNAVRETLIDSLRHSP